MSGKERERDRGTERQRDRRTECAVKIKGAIERKTETVNKNYEITLNSLFSKLHQSLTDNRLVKNFSFSNLNPSDKSV